MSQSTSGFVLIFAQCWATVEHEVWWRWWQSRAAEVRACRHAEQARGCNGTGFFLIGVHHKERAHGSCALIMLACKRSQRKIFMLLTQAAHRSRRMGALPHIELVCPVVYEGTPGCSKGHGRQLARSGHSGPVRVECHVLKRSICALVRKRVAKEPAAR